MSCTRRFVAIPALVIAGVASAVVAYHSGRFAQRQQSWERAASMSDWSPAHFLAEVRTLSEWGVTDAVPGNAAAHFWPSGIAVMEPACPKRLPSMYDSPSWEDPDLDWESAASCGRADDIVRAAQLRELDLGAWRYGADAYGRPDELRYMHVYREPIYGIGALIARAHLRIDHADYARAEADARAAVSAALHLVYGATDIDAMVWSVRMTGVALDHLREIHERRGDEEGLAAVAGAMDRARVAGVLLNRFIGVVRKAAASPATIHHARRVAQDSRAPAGFRAYAGMMVGYAWIANPREAILGPSGARRYAMAELAQQAELRPVIRQARTSVDLPVRRRLELLEQMWAVMN